MSEKLAFDPGVAAGLAVSAAIAIFVPIVLALVFRKRTLASWRWLGLGVATFIVSQGVCRLPWQIPLGVWLGPRFEGNDPLLYGWLVASSLTAGLFEETGRYLGFRYFAKRERSVRVAGMAGIGHGGIESILFVGLTVVGSLVTYVMITRGSGLPGVPPDAMEKIVAQFKELNFGLALLGGVERLFSLCVHFSLSMMVMQCFLRRQLWWLPAAIGFHMAANLSAVVTMKLAGAVAAEAAVGGFAAAAIYISWRLRLTPPEQPSPPVG